MTSGWGGALQYPEYIKLIKENGNYKRFIPAPEEPGYFKRSLFSSMVQLWRVLAATRLLKSGNHGSERNAREKIFLSTDERRK